MNVRSFPVALLLPDEAAPIFFGVLVLCDIFQVPVLLDSTDAQRPVLHSIGIQSVVIRHYIRSHIHKIHKPSSNKFTPFSEYGVI